MEVYNETKIEEPKNVGEMIAQLRHTIDERTEYSKVIRDFNELYYKLSVQTWGGNTKWRGIPVFKTPTDLWIYQELIESYKPDLIIETGTCFGGSALYLRDICNMITPRSWIISIDNTHDHLVEKAKVERIGYLFGSSVSDEIMIEVKAFIAAFECNKVMVILDSDHTKEHVLKELELYAPLVSSGSMLIVEDTNTDGPFQAIREWQPQHTEFKQSYMCEKFLLTFCREGFLEKE